MAGASRQNDHSLTASRLPRPPRLARLADELERMPGNFAFVQAVSMAERALLSRNLEPVNFRYRINPSLAFPPSDIASLSIAESDDGAAQVDMVLNFLGLHGASSPLPAYFTEHVAKHRDGPDALRDFFDIFNHRLILLFHECCRKYRYAMRYRRQGRDRLSGRFFSFMGAGLPELRDAGKLRWSRLMVYMGLIAFSAESAGSLESILRHYFAHPDIVILPCIHRWVSIPADQRSLLGASADILGESFLIGMEVPDQTGKFRIRIAKLRWVSFMAFLPCGDLFAELQTVMRFVLRSRFEFDVELCLLQEAILPWLLGSEDALLGWSTWAGDGGDGVIILQTRYGGN